MCRYNINLQEEKYSIKYTKPIVHSVRDLGQ